MSFYPRRPDTGTAGKRTVLRANFFPLSTSPHTLVYQYKFNVASLHSEESPNLTLRRLFYLWLDQVKESGLIKTTPIFDGYDMIYSPVPLPFDGSGHTFLINAFPNHSSPHQQTDFASADLVKNTSIPDEKTADLSVSEATLVSCPSSDHLHSLRAKPLRSSPSTSSLSKIASGISGLSISSDPILGASLSRTASWDTASLSIPLLSGPTATQEKMSKDSPESTFPGNTLRFGWYQISIRRLPDLDMNRLHLFLQGRLLEAPLDCIAMLDVLLRQRPSLLQTRVGRSFFTPDQCVTIANGAELWRGFHQSLVPAMGQMLLNLDISATAFYQSGSALETAARILGRHSAADLRGPPINEKERLKLERHLRGLQVIVTHRGETRRKFRITRISATNANKTLFPLNGNPGMEESVYQYFLKKYQRRLQFPHLPVLVAGDPSKPVYLPMEVCEICPGQRHMRKLNEKQTAEMIKFTCQQPHVRSYKIQDGIQLVDTQDSQHLQAFGVSVSSEMVTVPARVLPPPTVSYHPSSKEPIITPKEGAWNLRDKMLAQGVILRSWAVVAFGNEHDYPAASIHQFLQLLIQTCQECGLFVENRQPPISYAQPSSNLERTLIDAYMVAGNTFLERPQLLICILPNTAVPLYAEIKRVSDTVIGIPTQCIQAKHMFAAKRQYCANVCLKINVKLGGMNSYLSSTQLPFVSERPTIILGADISFPTSGSGSNQSIAALVGSIDAHCSRYAAAIRVQPWKQENIADLKGMVIEILKTFFQSCGAKPQRIVYYRDGLSQSCFEDVSRKEIEAIRLACMELEDMYRPSITYIVVEKRHHARFFPLRKEDTDRSGNVLPGTVVEVGVTHPFEFDFYLCSHPGLQGTSKPTHYHVLFDENRFRSDTLQELTYRLCYLYCRATRSVSVVPPAYYAHLVAARARFHALNEDHTTPSDGNSSIGSGGSQGTLTGMTFFSNFQPTQQQSTQLGVPQQSHSPFHSPIGGTSPLALMGQRGSLTSTTGLALHRNLSGMSSQSSSSSYLVPPNMTPSLLSPTHSPNILISPTSATTSSSGGLSTHNLAPLQTQPSNSTKRKPSRLMLHTSSSPHETKHQIFAPVKAELSHVMYFM